jgi:hypothetical protein
VAGNTVGARPNAGSFGNGVLGGGPRLLQQSGPPRFSPSPGLSIEEFFRGEQAPNWGIVWRFEMTTDLQSEIKNQPVKTLDELEKVIDDVLKT